MATWEASYGRYVKLRVTATERDVQVANNRSWVRVESEIYYPGGTTARNAFSQTLKVNVNGSNIGTQTGITYSLNSGGVKKLNGYSSDWITHNADGTKSVNVTVTITDGAGDSATINQTLTLTTIARASTLNSASMYANLVPSTENWVDLGLARANWSFTHDISLMDGSTTIASWNGHGIDRWLSISGSQVNTLLTRMSTTTSKTLTLRVQTKSGSTNIGSVLTRNLTATVDDSVVPNPGTVSYNISGTGVDSTMGLYVQGISKVDASFSPTAGYGATITSRSVTIRKGGGNLDRQTVNDASGTFDKVVSYSGEYEVWGTVIDSRGRLQYTPSRFFTVQEYYPPSISSFTVARKASPQTTVELRGSGGHSSLGGKNTLTIRMQWLDSNGNWQTLFNGTFTSVANTFSASLDNGGYNVTTSYDLRLYISDSFGRTAIVDRIVSTQEVVFDIHKDLGVGIGKLHEQGTLDVAKTIYLEGNKISIQNKLLRLNDEDIVGYGKNTNGEYVWFNDGTMICWMNYVEATSACNIPYGSLFSTQNQLWTFPSGFYDYPAVSVYIVGGGAYIWGALGSSGSTNINISWMAYGAVSVSSNPQGSLIAIGRWKE